MQQSSNSSNTNSPHCLTPNVLMTKKQRKRNIIVLGRKKQEKKQIEPNSKELNKEMNANTSRSRVSIFSVGKFEDCNVSEISAFHIDEEKKKRESVYHGNNFKEDIDIYSKNKINEHQIQESKSPKFPKFKIDSKNIREEDLINLRKIANGTFTVKTPISVPTSKKIIRPPRKQKEEQEKDDYYKWREKKCLFSNQGIFRTPDISKQRRSVQPYFDHQRLLTIEKVFQKVKSNLITIAYQSLKKLLNAKGKLLILKSAFTRVFLCSFEIIIYQEIKRQVVKYMLNKNLGIGQKDKIVNTRIRRSFKAIPFNVAYFSAKQNISKLGLSKRPINEPLEPTKSENERYGVKLPKIADNLTSI